MPRLNLLAGHAVLIVVCAAFFVPMVWALSASVHTDLNVFAIPFQWIPGRLHWENYVHGWQAAPFARYFFNSMVVAVVVTVTTVVMGHMAGYAFAKFAFPGRDAVFMAIVATLLVPFSAIVVPVFIMVKQIGWADSFPGLIVPGMLSAQSVFLMRQYIRVMPTELMWSGRLDGASELQIYLRVILPLSAPVLSAIAVLTFVASWNNLLWPLVVIQSNGMDTVPLGLEVFSSTYFTNYVETSAMSLVAMIPAVAVFLVLGRRLVSSMLVAGGAFKG
jgi:multiple sugar transport system permease protein